MRSVRERCARQAPCRRERLWSRRLLWTAVADGYDLLVLLGRVQPDSWNPAADMLDQGQSADREGAVNAGVACGRGKWGFDCAMLEDKLEEPLVRRRQTALERDRIIMKLS